MVKAHKKKKIKRETRSTTKAQRAIAEAAETGKTNKAARITRSSKLQQYDATVDDGDGEDQHTFGAAPQFKEFIDAFNVPTEPDSDYISRLPNEAMDQVLSYLVIDHDPERAVKKEAEGSDYLERPHVLLSLAAMSKKLHAQVEGFSVHHLGRFKDIYGFNTTAELNSAKKKHPTRRSVRLAPQPANDSRAYRMELVKSIRTHCIKCNGHADYTARMQNYAGICLECWRIEDNDTMTLTDALKQYDLRDYMLIPTRKPGPRAKHTDLPKIPYYTKKGGTAIILGHCISYRFYKEDVARIARLVHGDIEAHMEQKQDERLTRKLKRRRFAKQELKIRFHRDQAAKDSTEIDKAYHEQRLSEYEALDPGRADYIDSECDEPDDLDASSSESEGYRSYTRRSRNYGSYDDIHERLCIEPDCCRCKSGKLYTLYEKHGMGYYMPYCHCGRCW